MDTSGGFYDFNKLSELDKMAGNFAVSDEARMRFRRGPDGWNITRTWKES